MSAIVGIHYLNQTPVDRNDLEQMVALLAHRGNDSVGIWVEGSVGLGHRLLWTTPESRQEHFPLVNKTGSVVLTADARIDNREELIAALHLSEFSKPSTDPITDSQLILSAYEQWGDRCPEHLLGDFAFVIWDQAKQQLFCARDHFGVKPFYYYQSEQVFVFATEIKALFCLSEVPHQINETKIAEHLDSSDSQPNNTFYQNILRLPPAHQLTISPAGINLQAYWRLDPTRELHLSSEEAAEQFLALFTEAVRCRLRSDFPIGAMLSGGLDSSSITCVARKILAAENILLHTFSARFDQVPQSDERLYQDAVLQQGNLQPHFLQADQRSPLTEVDRLMWHQDEAIDAGNLYLGWELYKSAQAENVRVILDGFDGDTTVSHGNEYLRELAQTEQWYKLWNETKAYGERFNLPWKKIFLTWLWRYGMKPKLAPFLKALNAKHKSPAIASTHPLLNSAFFQQSGLAEQCAIAPPKTERENHHRLLTRSVMPHILEIMDRSAGAFSVELRFPFFDKRLVEFCLALPPDQKLHQGWGRVVMRRAMTEILPEEVQWRVDKSNLHPSFEYGLRTFEKEQIEDVMLNHSDDLQSYVDIAKLRQIYQRFVAQTATETEVNLLWRTVTLSLWLRYNEPPSLSFIEREVMPTKN